MKPVYIDITNIPELERYTGISRVVSEIAVKFIRDGVDLRLLSYDPRKHAYCIIDNDIFLLGANGMMEDKKKCYTEQYIPADELESGSVFFDANSAWHTLPNRSWLLPRLKARQIRIVPLIYDIIPIRYPQYMVGQTLVRFMEFLTAHMTYASEILVNTDAVRQDLRKLFGEMGMAEKPIYKIGLGADFFTGKNSIDPDDELDPYVEEITEGRRFLLTVGTVEPRKNQKVLVEAYEKQIADMDIDVIIVGRIGWEMESFLERIKTNKKYNKGIYVLSGVNDATLDYLYKKAFMVVFPSYTEGYGLPTIEALINGIPIACSDIPVMREVGGDFCDYFDPDNADQLSGIVKKYADDNGLYTEKRRRIAEEYQPPRWSDSAREMESFLLGEAREQHFEHKPVKQVVFLSARPAPILETLPFIEEFMPFITELVVCCPDFMAEYMHKNYDGRLKLTTITDDELLGENTLPPDHSTRNFFLRCLAMQQDAIDDEFIMCDDDYRPLKPMTEEVFYKDGRYIGYYFSDISKWHYNITDLFSYDFCHFRTLGFLKKHGYPTLQYSSHQPQLINKVWYNELISRYPDIIRKGYDEWSTYFNYIAAEHREQYEPKPYVTLSWPPVGGDDKGVIQSDLIFENFYEDHYASGKVFGKFGRRFTNRERVLNDNADKVLIALKYRAEHNEAKKRSALYENEYEGKYSEFPSVSVYFGKSAEVPELGVPCYVQLSRTLLNRLKFSAARSRICAANIVPVCIEIKLVDENGGVHFARTVQLKPRLNHSTASFTLPDTLPEDKELFLNVRARLKNSVNAAEKTVPVVFTEESIPE